MSKFRDFLTILVIVFMTGVNVSPNAPRSLDSLDMASGNITTQIVKSLIYLIAFSLLILKWKDAVRLSGKNIFIWIALFWVLASAIWSTEPSITLRRSVGLLGTTVIALYFATRYDFKRFAMMASWSFLMINILSLLVIAFFPAQGISSYPYGWQGVYFTKNGLGVNALFGIILFAAMLGNRKTAALGIMGMVLSLILLIGSRSVTSLIVSVFVLSVWGVLHPFFNRNRPVFIASLFCLLIFLLFGVWLYLTDNIEIVFRMLGKDPTLTGRVPIWEIVLLYIRQSPWLGYGYGAVWLGKDYGIGSSISSSINYYVVNAHNGYLDLILEIGVIGVVLVLMVIVAVLAKLIADIRHSTRVSSYELWPIVVVIALVVYNSTEAMLLVQNSIAWILIAYLGFGIPGNGDSQPAAHHRREKLTRAPIPAERLSPA